MMRERVVRFIGGSLSMMGGAWVGERSCPAVGTAAARTMSRVRPARYRMLDRSVFGVFGFARDHGSEGTAARS